MSGLLAAIGLMLASVTAPGALVPGVDVREYGAVGDGTTDDAAAIQRALDQGGHVHIPAGTFKVSRQLTVPPNTVVTGAGPGVSVITAAGAAPDTKAFPDRAVLFVKGGTFREIGPLQRHANRFQTEIVVNDAGQKQPVAAGNLLVLVDPRPGSFNRARPESYRAGEFVRVAAVVSRGVLELAGPVQGWRYDADHAAVWRLDSPSRSRVEDLSIIATQRADDDAVACLRAHGQRDLVIRDVHVSGAHGVLLELRRCVDAVVEYVTGEQLFPVNTRSGTNYGVGIANCQDVRIENCRITSLRHAISVGGAAAPPAPVNRFITVRECDLRIPGGPGATQALDTHGNADQFTFEKNIVHGGVIFGGSRGRIIDNDIFSVGKGLPSIAVYAREWASTEHEIRDNRIRGFAAPDESGERGVVHLFKNKHTRDGGPTIVRGNHITIEGRAPEGVRGIMARDAGAPEPWRLFIEENHISADTRGVLIDIDNPDPLRDVIWIRWNILENGWIADAWARQMRHVRMEGNVVTPRDS